MRAGASWGLTHARGTITEAARIPEFVEDRQLARLSSPPKLKQKRARCGAQTRRKLPCQRKALANGRVASGHLSLDNRKRSQTVFYKRPRRHFLY